MSKRFLLSGFSLVEVLVVLGVIGLLLAIFFPVVGGVQEQARTSKTKAQLAGYATVYQAFKADRGYYPTMGASGAEFNIADDNDAFIETLTGYAADGGPMRDPYARQANPRQTRYYTFIPAEFADTDDPEAAGVDRDQNGVIAASDFKLLPATERPANLHGGVVFYTHVPAKNETGWKQVKSWE